MDYSLAGVWEARLSDGRKGPFKVPGTLDENSLGDIDCKTNSWHPDITLGNAADGPGSLSRTVKIATRLTRRFTFEGEACIRTLLKHEWKQDKRYFLFVERARCLQLLLAGRRIEAAKPQSISTPQIFELSEVVRGLDSGEAVELTLLSDNSYPGLPHDAIVYSSAATDETQTNWNGLLGRVELQEREACFVEGLYACYCAGTHTVDVEIEFNSEHSYEGEIELQSALWAETVRRTVALAPGRTSLRLTELPLQDNLKRWDIDEGILYPIELRLDNGAGALVNVGLRTFAANAGGRLTLNGRTIFILSETNCAVFPETGYPPMEIEDWREILRTYRNYGVNLVRFHSHCPPEAAFIAADEMGMLMQPELSHWNPRDAFVAPEALSYYRTELLCVLKMLHNHPSFVMLTLGNELASHEQGHRAMDSLLELATREDPTRLYANASNAHYGQIGCDPRSDFHTTQKFYDLPLRGTFAADYKADAVDVPEGKVRGLQGHINRQYPSAAVNYDETMAKLRERYAKPVFSFEVGQFEILPSFDEIQAFRGVTRPVNYELVREMAERKGLLAQWNRYVEATGELSLLAYREEVEAAIRTRELSGISLLGLQDFPGQGTALVGMLNAHLKTKPYAFARPERFSAFFKDVLPLALLPKYTYEEGEVFKVKVQVANYGKDSFMATPKFCLRGEDSLFDGELSNTCIVQGELTDLGEISICLKDIKDNEKLSLELVIGEAVNTYPIWVYKKVEPSCPENVYECRSLDERAHCVLREGGVVYLSPPSTLEAMPRSIRTEFTTDFWSVGTFAAQEGTMGQLIDEEHPIFSSFPTRFHSEWQWWPMASTRAMVLPDDCDFRAIITEIDSYAFMRKMAQLIEWRCENGVILLSTMGLQDLQQYPEARALQQAIYNYLEFGKAKPAQQITFEALDDLLKIKSR